jgi:hypothetical protein
MTWQQLIGPEEALAFASDAARSCELKQNKMLFIVHLLFLEEDVGIILDIFEDPLLLVFHSFYLLNIIERNRVDHIE